MAADRTIRPMKRQELDTLLDWAAQEGWNPGLHDAEIFWHTDQSNMGSQGKGLSCLV
jgi:hypothetical protein